jgi:hypothetical protein
VLRYTDGLLQGIVYLGRGRIGIDAVDSGAFLPTTKNGSCILSSDDIELVII